MTCRQTRDRGAADALGLVLIAPIVVGLALLVVALGRRVDGRAEAQSAAESAAQAAALQRSPSAARRAGTETAMAMLGDHGSCDQPDVRVDTTDFRPGGVIRVTVRCDSARVIDAVPAARQHHDYTAVAHIDLFRSTELP